MKIRFLQDYRGVLTGEQFFRKGDEADLEKAAQLVKDGRAEFVGKAEPEEEPAEPEADEAAPPGVPAEPEADEAAPVDVITQSKPKRGRPRK